MSKVKRLEHKKKLTYKLNILWDNIYKTFVALRSCGEPITIEMIDFIRKVDKNEKIQIDLQRQNIKITIIIRRKF